MSSFSALIHLVGFFARAGFVFALVSGICAFSFCFSLFVGCLFVAFWIRIRLLGRYFPFPMLNRSSRKCLAHRGFSTAVFVTISFRASWRGHLWKVSRGLFVMALLIPQRVGPTMSNDTTGRQVKIKMDGIPLFQIFFGILPFSPTFRYLQSLSRVSWGRAYWRFFLYFCKCEFLSKVQGSYCFFLNI